MMTKEASQRMEQSDRSVRIGVVGFGTGGLNFHSPFIEAADGVELAGVVTRSAERRRVLANRFPGVPAYDSLADLAHGEQTSAGLDAVTITTPPDTREALVLEALDHGLHVIADKPFAPTADAAIALDQAAEAAGLILGVYHNRRWDSDVRTLKAVLDSGELGRVTRFHSRFDADDPATLEGGPHGGLLRDLGSHIVDQALWLFGPVEQVFARVEEAPTPDGPTDVAFVIVLVHRDGTMSEVSASKLNRLQERELRLYGELGSYLSRSTDVQAEAIFAGRRPVDDPRGWGHEPESAWGTLRTAEGARRIPAEQGSYVQYYELFAQAIRIGGPPPVSAAEAVETLAVLDAARHSAASGSVVAPESRFASAAN
jgi:predicted dehydrogenase